MKNMFASLLRHGTAAPVARALGAPTAWRLLGCYAVASVFVVGLDMAAPLPDTGGGRVWTGWLQDFASTTAVKPEALPVWLDALLAMAGAFLITVPIVIVYVRTRTHEVFDDSLANTILVLPPIVTAILVVVHTSLAVAFSLAGIVAAVRFRINLKESRDALYIFAGVAIGFAAGIYALDVALMTSIVFVLLEILIWRTDLGAATVSPAGGQGKEKEKEKEKARDHDARAPEADPPTRDMVLRVQVTDADAGRHAVESLLETLTKSWHRVRVGGGRDGALVAIDYEIRLRKRYSADEVRDRLRRDGQPFITAAELAPLEPAATGGRTVTEG